MAVWFGSDTHFHHFRIASIYPARAGFASADEMATEMLRRWNSQVSDNDEVFHIGDVDLAHMDLTLGLIPRLKGRKFLVPGNHDRKLIKQKRLHEHFTVLPDIYERRFGQQHIVMCHYPIWEWNQMHRGYWHLHGHLHGKPHGIPGKILDVSVDANDLMLRSFEDVELFMVDREIRKHH